MGKLSSPAPRLKAAPYRLALPSRTERGEAAQRAVQPWRAWYNTAAWRVLRIEVFKRDRFTCQWPGCGRVEGNTSKLVCDHRRPHRGDQALFWDRTNLQTLCKTPCHDRHKQALEQASRFQGGIWD